MARDVGKHALVLDLAAVAAEICDVRRRQHDAAAGHAEASTETHVRVRVLGAHERGVQHAGPLDLARVPQPGRHARVHTSSTARRTSAAITRRRYAAEPRESLSGSIRSA